MEKHIRITEAIDKQIRREREKWNDLLEYAWPSISLYVGKAFDMPIYSFRHFSDITEGFGTHVLAIKQPEGALKFYHPLGCLFTKGRTLFYERMLVKLVRFVEVEVHPKKKPHSRGNDVFNYSLQEVSDENVSRMLGAGKAQEATGFIVSLIKKVNAEISSGYSS